MNERPWALVTGGSSGIGVCYARALARRGFDLVLVARRGDRLDAVARSLDTRAEPLVADLADPAGLAAVVSVCRTRPIDLLVNNAALGHYMPFVELPAERAEELVRINTLAVVSLTSAAVKPMIERRRGAVINVASLLAFSGPSRVPALPARAVYAASKAFLVTFSQVLAGELQGTGVKVQVVCPGLVVSEFHTRQGIDMSARPRLAAEDVVEASLRDLDAAVVVSIPTLEDGAALDRVNAAQAELMAAALPPALATRYRT